MKAATGLVWVRRRSERQESKRVRIVARRHLARCILRAVERAGASCRKPAGGRKGEVSEMSQDDLERRKSTGPKSVLDCGST